MWPAHSLPLHLSHIYNQKGSCDQLAGFLSSCHLIKLCHVIWTLASYPLVTRCVGSCDQNTCFLSFWHKSKSFSWLDKDIFMQHWSNLYGVILCLYGVILCLWGVILSLWYYSMSCGVILCHYYYVCLVFTDILTKCTNTRLSWSYTCKHKW